MPGRGARAAEQVTEGQPLLVGAMRPDTGLVGRQRVYDRDARREDEGERGTGEGHTAPRDV